MEKTTQHDEIKGCCTGSTCGTGCCKGNLWRWLLGILAVLAIFWLGMHVGFSKAMWHRGGGDGGKDGGGCGMSKFWGDDDRNDDDRYERKGMMYNNPVVQESGTVATGA